ncbi:MAG: hypothetical protein KF849_13615 [Rhizobiaceae bacterium]|nr:hypothetical protein [Rhizobiaceae bacterium]
MRVAIFLPLALLALPGCMASDLDRDGVTTFAGDAIAYNSALQVVDPWEYGVQQTNLKVPAERAASATAAAGADSAGSATGGKP